MIARTRVESVVTVRDSVLTVHVEARMALQCQKTQTTYSSDEGLSWPSQRHTEHMWKVKGTWQSREQSASVQVVGKSSSLRWHSISIVQAHSESQQGYQAV